MSTITISLPEKIARKVDQKAKQQGFATRSEFVRSLLRQNLREDFELEEFEQIKLEKVALELAKTGKYTQDFIESVTSGLKKSSAYAK
ncbi:MAG: ribbon-helix-helix domain-containing protein [Patescibacteria group bacterium]